MISPRYITCKTSISNGFWSCEHIFSSNLPSLDALPWFCRATIEFLNIFSVKRGSQTAQCGSLDAGVADWMEQQQNSYTGKVRLMSYKYRYVFWFK